MLKEFNFNKLGEAALFHLSLYADVAKTEMAGLPESFSNKQQIYRGNKSQLLKIFDPTPYLIALKKDDLISDFSEIVNSKAAVTTVKITELLNLSTISLLYYSHIDIVIDRLIAISTIL